MSKLLILLFLINTTDPAEISKYNRLKNKAEIAFEKGQFDVAAQNYSMLYDSLSADDPAIALNLAHSYYALGDTSNALLKYQAAASSDNRKIKSISYQQLGVMADKPETLNESLQYLKSALKADPSNEEARFNYELVKKKLENQQDQQDDQQQQDQDNQENKDQEKNEEKQDQQNGDQDQQDEQNQEQENQENQEQQDQEQESQDEQNKEQEGQEQQEQEGKEGEQQESEQQEGQEQEEEQKNENQDMSTQQKLEQMNISEEKAKMILEAMKNNEIQYIQQQRRKPTKAPQSGKPDW